MASSRVDALLLDCSLKEVLVVLKGKVALVTGGSRGLGKAMVSAFAENGADVIVASRKLDSCETAAADVRERFGREALASACDVSEWAQCDQLVDAAYAKFGRVDILVNNAGGSPPYSSLDKVTEKMWNKTIALNLRGPFRLSALIGARMSGDRGGAIINISSKAAVLPTSAALPYAAAKAGLNALTEGLAQAFGPHVRVNAIQCGVFRTEGSGYWTDNFESKLAKKTALGRIGVANEVADAAVYFASDASSFCTGATLSIDGGLVWTTDTLSSE